MKIRSTAVDIGSRVSKFLNILDRQFTGCATKYAFNEDSEWTDVITMFVPFWVEGTIMKYLGRLKVYARERDWIKVATYCFILWIKYGLHSELEERDGRNTHCTTVEQKAKYWPEFKKLVEDRMSVLQSSRLGGKEWTKYDLRVMFSKDALIDDIFDDMINSIRHAGLSTGVPWDDREVRSRLLVNSAALCLLSWVQCGFYEAEEHDEDLGAEKDDVEIATKGR